VVVADSIVSRVNLGRRSTRSALRPWIGRLNLSGPCARGTVGNENLDAVLTLTDWPAKLLPGLKAGDLGGFWLLREDYVESKVKPFSTDIKGNRLRHRLLALPQI
jgi:hypothetical protein